jgi:hypothetical protein
MDVPTCSADSQKYSCVSFLRGAQSYALNVGKPASRNLRKSITVFTVLRNAFDRMQVANLKVATNQFTTH